MKKAENASVRIIPLGGLEQIGIGQTRRSPDEIVDLLGAAIGRGLVGEEIRALLHKLPDDIHNFPPAARTCFLDQP